MSTPLLTIGMAHAWDYDGVWFTCMNLCLQIPRNILSQIQFVVIDNTPNTPEGKLVKQYVENWLAHAGVHSAVYVPFEENNGTSQTRGRVFTEAKGRYVLCVDCHVLFPPKTIENLLNWYTANSETKDLMSGPIFFDTLNHHSTHFNPIWRSEMFGIWSTAWKCGCKGGVYFTTNCSNPDDVKLAVVNYHALDINFAPMTQCGKCKKQFSNLPWIAHEQELRKQGYREPGLDISSPPFEIPGMGLGVFTCAKDAWQEFHPDHRGFGGEELYIHEKFRQQGYKAICLPFLQWVHRFGRPNGVKYRLTRWDKARNYLLHFAELGWDTSPIRGHFVEKNKFLTEEQWKHLIADPVKNVQPPAQPQKEQPCQTGNCGDNGQPPTQGRTLEEIFNWTHTQHTRDLDKHLPILREWGNKVKHITEISKRRESTIAFLAAKPTTLISYNTEHDEIFERLKKISKTDFQQAHVDSTMVPEIGKTEMLFIDSVEQTGERFKTELDKYYKSVTRLMAFHDTQLYGEKGEDGQPGLMVVLREFMKLNPEWSVVYHTTNQYGLTILSKSVADKPAMPSTIQLFGNFAGAMLSYVGSGLDNCSNEQATKRLEVCTICEQRVNDRCAACGCFLAPKAVMKTVECPLGKWSQVDESFMHNANVQ